MCSTPSSSSSVRTDRNKTTKELYLLNPNNKESQSHMAVPLHRAFTGALDHLSVLPSPAWQTDLRSTPRSEHLPHIFLVREGLLNGENGQLQGQPQQCYALLPGKHAVEHEMALYQPNWGHKLSAVVYPRIGPTTFEAPVLQDTQFVEIQRLNRSVVDNYVQQGGTEHDPYQQVQQDPAVVEFLHDDTFLFVVLTVP